MATVLDVIVDDITRQPVDAIVNAANGTLLGGGGVDGAIHRAAGPELKEACRPLGGALTGEAKITPGFRLPARFVIHTVGPVWHGGTSGEPKALADCYWSSLTVATDNGCRTVAFPAISTGVFGYPPAQAAPVAVETVEAFVEDHPEALDRIVFCCFSEGSAALHRAALDGRPA